MRNQKRSEKVLERNYRQCGSEAWTIFQGDLSRITASEMKFATRAVGYTRLDYKKN